MKLHNTQFTLVIETSRKKRRQAAWYYQDQSINQSINHLRIVLFTVIIESYNLGEE